MHKVLFLFMVIATLGTLSACTNTVEGFGRDMESAGESIQNSM